MFTSRDRTTVSLSSRISWVSLLGLAVWPTAVVVSSACARVQSFPSSGGAEAATSPSPQRGPALTFDNQAGIYVDVYLVSEQRQWRLGRVVPGGRMTFGLPDDELANISGFVRLAVLAGAPASLQVTREPAAILTIPQPVSVLLSQGWAFRQSQAASASQLQGTTLRRP